MTSPIHILLQTTIPPTEDDWGIHRFSLLHAFLEGLVDDRGELLCRVTARDRAAGGGPDPILSAIDELDFDQLWLFAVDVGDGLDVADCEAIGRFWARGGGLLVTRDHMDLGSSVCTLGGIGLAHHFHSRNREPDAARHIVDDWETGYILWPNYHSGANGDFQEIEAADPPYVLLHDPDAPGGVIRYLPAHPHEGAVGAPPDDPTARVIATGVSKASGRRFNLAVAFESVGGHGAAVAESTFHHFADYNWDTAAGCPSFVTEPSGTGLANCPEAAAQVRRYVRNLALWLARRPPDSKSYPTA